MKIQLLILAAFLRLIARVLGVFATLLALVCTVVMQLLNDFDWSLQSWELALRNRPGSNIAWRFWHLIALCSSEPGTKSNRR